MDRVQSFSLSSVITFVIASLILIVFAAIKCITITEPQPPVEERITVHPTAAAPQIGFPLLNF